MKAAFVSYNAIQDFNAGWHNSESHSVLIIPNSKGAYLAALFEGESGNRCVTDEITRLWQQLSDSLAEIDKVVVYVGTDGSEVAIDLAGRLPAERVVYVLCNCDIDAKRRKIARVGHEQAAKILCECRGISTMSRLALQFLSSGHVS